VLGGGMSCEGARSKYIEDYSKDAPPDLSAGSFGNVLNRGNYLNACSVPSSVSVSICAAIQNGRAVGVTVSTTPSNPGVNSCVAGQVRALSFPAHPRLDVTTTTFAAQ
jgi:eukaryotic-like serine/threonine-protein kinase